jgi:hypothetical protein
MGDPLGLFLFTPLPARTISKSAEMELGEVSFTLGNI